MEIEMAHQVGRNKEEMVVDQVEVTEKAGIVNSKVASVEIAVAEVKQAGVGPVDMAAQTAEAIGGIVINKLNLLVI